VWVGLPPQVLSAERPYPMVNCEPPLWTQWLHNGCTLGALRRGKEKRPSRNRPRRLIISWRAQQDSNLRPSGPQYETDPRNDAGLRLLPCKGLQGAAPGCTRDGSRLYPAPTFRESPAAPDQPGRDPHPLPLPRPTRARIGGVKIDCETEACPRGAPSAGQCGWSGELPGSSNVPHEKDPQTDEEKEREPVNQEGRPEW